jgi:acyl-CoA synthetase (AMP-forming)/AMP-acid ligase II
VTPSLSTSYWPADNSEPILELTTGDLLRRCADDSGDHVAFVEVAPPGSEPLTGADRIDRTWTYRELLEDATRCAGYLTERFSPGERIAAWAPNVPEWVILQYGAALAGLVLVTANPALRTEELRYVLEQSQASALMYVRSFRGSDMAAIAEAVAGDCASRPAMVDMSDWATRVRSWDPSPQLPTVAPDDAAQIQYTSGTTGAPKGALLHHRGLVTNAYYIGLRYGANQGVRVVSAMPLFHTAGCGMLVLGTAHLRGTIYLLQAFDPALMLDTVESAQAEMVTGVPTMFIAMLDHPSFAQRDLSCCQVGVSGGTGVPAEVARRIESRFGLTLSTVFGQTELSPVMTQTGAEDSESDRLYTGGRPLWNVEVKSCDTESGATAPIGTQGEICSRGYQTMLGYFNMPQQTADTIDDEGWLHTGDLGVLDERGYLTVTGRLKDMIIRGGENVYPREIEELLFTHPGIAQAAVVGVPDERWGEVIAAIVAPRGDARPTAGELHSLCRKHLAPHKTPVQWYCTEAYPMTSSGKLQKFRITEGIVAGDYPTLPDEAPTA